MQSLNQKVVHCSISPMMRTALSRKKAREAHVPGAQFLDGYISTEHPCVSRSFLEKMLGINKRYRLFWELQLNDEFRWHVYMHRAISCMDRPVHVMLVADDDYGFRALDGRTLDRLRLIDLWSQDPVRFVKQMHREEDEAEERRIKALDDSIDDVSRYYRRLFARLATNEKNPDSYWAPGITKTEDGWETGVGPKNAKVSTVVAGERRL